VAVLANLEDANGRRAVDVAALKTKKAIMARLYFYRRYEITQRQVHKSGTCQVMIAVDHLADKQRVALKLMANQDQFEREVYSPPIVCNDRASNVRSLRRTELNTVWMKSSSWVR
jgi:hypothetical protein